MWAVAHESREEVAILGVHAYWPGDIFGDGHWDTEFADGDVGFGGDDRARTKVNAFAHQILSDTAAFAVEALFESAHWATGPLDDGGEGGAGQLVVNLSGDVVLQKDHVVIDGALVGILFDESSDALVRFEDGEQDDSHIILSTRVSIMFH